MKFIRRCVFILIFIALLLWLGSGVLYLYLKNADWGYARPVSPEAKAYRDQVVATAEQWLGCMESDGSHREIIDLYNAHEPLAQNYTVTYEDNWCAAYASAVAIQCGLTDIVPTECGCQRQISLWQNLDRWEENDNHVPLPGDYIYFAWDESFSLGDCTGWADHVGIVVGTHGPFLKVIEGNRDDQVACHYLLLGDWQIRGYGLPDYENRT